MEIQKKIARKLILGIVVFSGILSLVITAVQLYFEFQRDKDIITSQLTAIEQTSIPSLDSAIWISDSRQIEILLSSIRKNKHISYVELTTDTGQVFYYGVSTTKSSFTKEYAILHTTSEGTQPTGKLLIQVDLQEAYNNLYRRIGYVLVSNLLKTFLVALFIYYLIHILVIRHLIKIADYVRNFNVGDNQVLSLDTDKSVADDEIGELATSVNIMATNIKDLVAEVSENEEKNRLLLDATAEAIFGIDLDGCCTFANPACIKSLGYSTEEELYGKNIHYLIHHTHRDGTHYAAKDCPIDINPNATSSIHVDNEIFWRKDNSFFEVEYRARPIYKNHRKTGTVVSFIDITNKLEAMRQLKTAKKMAEAANYAKSTFLANMSHEVRTPMNAILGMTNLALDAHPDERQRKYLHRIDNAATMLLGIVNDILDFSKIEAGKLNIEHIEFELAYLVENIISVSSVSAREKDLKLTTHIDNAIPPVLFGDPLRLNQVLHNLISNAIKFTPGGEVKLLIEPTEQKENAIKLNFSVKDTGIGLSDQQRDTLFDAFSQADSSITRQYGGTGLGLAICKQLVSLMGGDIYVESQQNSGSTFFFSLWFDIGKEAKIPVRHGIDTNVDIRSLRERLSGAKILLVEDNEINQEVATEMLSNSGVEVDIANNGQQAIDKITAATCYDGVLMDIQMPIMDGITATREIRRTLSATDLPIIALTANAMKLDRDNYLSVGMNDYISKPIDKVEFFTTLVRWIKPKTPATTISMTDDTHSTVVLPAIANLDVDSALDKLGQNRALYRKLLFKFRDIHADFPQSFRDARNQGDTEKARRLAHTFKSVSSTLGAEQLRAAAAELEQLAIENDQDTTINLHLGIIEADLPPLIAAINDYE